MKEFDEAVMAGQAVYSPRVLALYDWWVLGISNRFIWKCPTPGLLDFYNQWVSANHLDIGVGTGFYPDRCRFPGSSPRLALMDLNPNSLAVTARRVARYRPECYRHNVLQPIATEIAPFDSIAVNYLLHCLPGAMAEKTRLFRHLESLLNPGGVVFGATLLQDGVKRGSLARGLMRFYNHKGIFSNQTDALDALSRALDQHFTTSGLRVEGCAALFWGTKSAVVG